MNKIFCFIQWVLIYYYHDFFWWSYCPWWSMRASSSRLLCPVVTSQHSLSTSLFPDTARCFRLRSFRLNPRIRHFFQVTQFLLIESGMQKTGSEQLACLLLLEYLCSQAFKGPERDSLCMYVFIYVHLYVCVYTICIYIYIFFLCLFYVRVFWKPQGHTDTSKSNTKPQIPFSALPFIVRDPYFTSDEPISHCL